MSTAVEFGNIEAARKVRNNPQYKAFVADEDVPQSKTVTLKDVTPQGALDDITGEAAETKRHEAEKAGQAGLTKHERKAIDFSREGVDIPTVRAIKGIAVNFGVGDWMSFADLELTVDENRQVLREAAREERGRRGMGRDDMSDERIDQRLAQAHTEKKSSEVDRAKQFALVETDPEAQEFVQGNATFDIAFNRQNNQLIGQGEDFERLEDRHEKRSGRAQRTDERKSAQPTRDPVQWSNNPNEYDYPGVDTVQPKELHEERSEQAQTRDEQEVAPQAETKEQWAINPGRYDWRSVDRPASYGPTMNMAQPINPNEEPETRLMEVFAERDVSMSPDEVLNDTGARSPNALGGLDTAGIIEGEMAPRTEPEEPPEEALQQQSRTLSEGAGIMDNFADDRDSEGKLTDFGMETDATQHRESREAEEKATTFGIDDRDDVSRGAENDTNTGEQEGLGVFGGGTRENETLF